MEHIYFGVLSFGLFEAMSAIEMMDPKMDAGMIGNQVNRKVLNFEQAIKVCVSSFCHLTGCKRILWVTCGASLFCCLHYYSDTNSSLKITVKLFNINTSNKYILEIVLQVVPCIFCLLYEESWREASFCTLLWLLVQFIRMNRSCQI